MTGCVKYPVVGSFGKLNEVARGTVRGNLLTGGGTIEIEGSPSKVKCRGKSVVKHIPNPFSCKGQSGVAHLICDDGRTLDAEWTATACTSGFGAGTDDEGHPFRFTFGLKERETEVYLANLKKNTERFDPLPAAGSSASPTSGTGFFVSEEGHVVTAYHVIEHATAIEVIDASGLRSPANLVQFDQANDLAIIHVGGHRKALPVNQAPAISKGAEVLTLGYPLVAIQGQEQKATFGRVNAVSGIKDDPRYMQIDVPIQPGNSGGPLISSDGQVIGVITASINQWAVLSGNNALAQNVNFAMKSDYLFPLLRQASVPLVTFPFLTEEPLSNLQAVVRACEQSIVLVIAK